MSKKLEPPDFAKERDHLMRSTTPVPFRAQQAWLGDWKTAADRMQYMDVQVLDISDSLRSLIRVRGKLRRPNLSLELVKPDVENLWTDIVSNAQDAAHSFRDSDTGFEFSFFALSGKSYITGSIVVNRHSTP